MQCNPDRLKTQFLSLGASLKNVEKTHQLLRDFSTKVIKMPKPHHLLLQLRSRPSGWTANWASCERFGKDIPPSCYRHWQTLAAQTPPWWNPPRIDIWSLNQIHSRTWITRAAVRSILNIYYKIKHLKRALRFRASLNLSSRQYNW